jgi:hypothetical protein
MSFVVSLTWLKRGIAKTPTKLKIDREELEQILKSSKKKERKKKKQEKEETESEIEEEVEENDEIKEDSDDISSKYKLENYDEEEDG